MPGGERTGGVRPLPAPKLGEGAGSNPARREKSQRWCKGSTSPPTCAGPTGRASPFRLSPGEGEGLRTQTAVRARAASREDPASPMGSIPAGARGPGGFSAPDFVAQQAERSAETGEVPGSSPGVVTVAHPTRHKSEHHCRPGVDSRQAGRRQRMITVTVMLENTRTGRPLVGGFTPGRPGYRAGRARTVRTGACRPLTGQGRARAAEVTSGSAGLSP